jgi:hypothetical protein
MWDGQGNRPDTKVILDLQEMSKQLSKPLESSEKVALQLSYRLNEGDGRRKDRLGLEQSFSAI